MKRFTRKTPLVLAIFLIASIALSACGMSASPEPGPQEKAALTKAAEIVSTLSAGATATEDSLRATKVVGEALGTVYPAPTEMPYMTVTPINSYPATPTATQILLPTATYTPKVIKSYCAGAGGQWFSDVNDGLQFAGFFDRTKLMTTGLPMQAYYGQTSNTGINQYTYKDKVFIIEDTRETWNDGGMTQLIGCEDDNGQLHIYMAERKNDSFNKVSYVIWTANGPVGYTHDDGDPGTWEGSPSGSPIAYIEVFANTVPSDLKTHYDMIVQLMSGPAPMYFDNGVITAIWHKPE